MHTVAILAFEGCWGLSLFSASDFFRIVQLLEQHAGQAPSYRAQVISWDGKALTTASGPDLQPQAAVDPRQVYDTIIIPAIEGPRLLTTLPWDSPWLTWLHRQKQAGARILALTTGVALAAAAGIAGTTLMATHWAFLRPLRERFPHCRFTAHPAYLQADGLWSTGSTQGGFDALLDMLAHDKGDAFAQLCATHLLVAAPEQLNPSLPAHRNHCDVAVLKVQDWLSRRYAQTTSIATMAHEAGLAERTFKRRFTQATQLSPNRYVQKLRVDKAKKLLLATDLPIKTVAYEVGYDNVGFFVRLFQQHTGHTPAQWRTGTLGLAAV